MAAPKNRKPETMHVVAGDGPNPMAHVDGEKLRRALVEMNGPKAAGWLLFKYRRRLHETGRIHVDFPGKASAAPAWFRTAVELLGMRDYKWQVTVRELAGGGTRWIIFWKGWLSNGPKHREELRRLERNKRKRLRNLRS